MLIPFTPTAYISKIGNATIKRVNILDHLLIGKLDKLFIKDSSSKYQSSFINSHMHLIKFSPFFPNYTEYKIIF